MQVQQTTPQTFMGLIKLSKNVFGRSWGGRKSVATAPTHGRPVFLVVAPRGLQIRQIQLEKGDNERSRGTEAETHDWTALIRRRLSDRTCCLDAERSRQVAHRKWSIKLPARVFSLHTIDISELRLSKAYTRSFTLRRISLINDAT